MLSEHHFRAGKRRAASVGNSQLGPGTYYVTGGAGFNGGSGSGSARFEVSCCSETVQDHDSASGEGSGGVPFLLVISIGDDGTCSIRSSENLPTSPCPEM